MYVIRVEFPDDDKYAYVTNEDGELKKFATRELAEKEAQQYAGYPIVQEIEDEGVNWSL